MHLRAVTMQRTNHGTCYIHVPCLYIETRWHRVFSRFVSCGFAKTSPFRCHLLVAASFLALQQPLEAALTSFLPKEYSCLLIAPRTCQFITDRNQRTAMLLVLCYKLLTWHGCMAHVLIAQSHAMCILMVTPLNPVVRCVRACALVSLSNLQ